MPVTQTRECNNCGNSYLLEHERCPKCGMYKDEDVEDFNKFLDSQEDKEIFGEHKPLNIHLTKK